ncbi:PREDICTED: integrin alpha-4, partial [Galeopterus variegatus]|uniref:Integrin alpha-4 n=1 Tax=Galeopterus variegatus TaxID=482537 RepID=A0ABM0SFR2_GALVR
PHENKTYLAVGSMKTLMLNVSLFNAGDDAFETALHVMLPTGLYFVKILDLEEKQINCEVTDNSGVVKLDCNVGYIYVDHLSRIDISFLLDVSSLSRAEEDLNITVHATCENEGEMDALKHNKVTLAIPLKYEVMLTVHGFVNPTSFVYGPTDENEPENCMAEKMNFTFHVINTGNSMAPNVSVEIMVPNSFIPQTDKLFNILDVQPTTGECHFKTYQRECALERPKGAMETLKGIFTFLSKTDKRLLYCIKADPHCLSFLCNFGKMESGKEASVHIQLEGRPSILEMAGFFKRQYKSVLQEENRRDSWSYINSKSNNDD